jgi:hypothetical protein
VAGIPAEAVAVDGLKAFDGENVYLTKAQGSPHVAALLARPGGVTLYAGRRPVPDERTDESLLRALEFLRRILGDFPLTKMNLDGMDRVIRAVLEAA